MFKRLGALLLALVLVGSLPLTAHARWDEEEENYWRYGADEEIRDHAGTVSMEVGETRSLQPEMLYQNSSYGVAVYNTGTWSTDRASVATVDSSGNVTAHKSGSATVKVVYVDNRNNQITRTIRVKVGPKTLTSSAYTSEEYSFTVTEGRKLSVRQLLFQDLPADEIQWTTDHDNLLTTDQNGLITTLRFGTANVYGTHTAPDGTRTDKKLTVTIQSMQTTNTLQPVTITLYPGQKVDLKELLYPDNQLPGSYNTLSSTVDNAGTATLSDHTLTAKSPGTCNAVLVLSRKNDMNGESHRQKVKVRVVEME